MPGIPDPRTIQVMWNVDSLERWHNGAGVITWLIVSAVTLYVVGDTASITELLAGIALMGIILVAMVVASGPFRTGPATRLGKAALWTHVTAAFGLGLVFNFDFLQIFTIIWIAIAPAFYTARQCVALMALIVVGWYCVKTWYWDEANGVLVAALFGTFHYFALLSSLATREAERSREQALALNRELLATQRQLEAATRDAERTRIARDLHDLIGHHLTALSIHLQVASRKSSGEAAASIDKCHSISKLLLSDVRAAVSELRSDETAGFDEQLKRIADDSPGIEIRWRIDAATAAIGTPASDVLLHAVREAVTNTLRHANATVVSIDIASAGGAITARISDNGRVEGTLSPGNGLNGMRERVERLGGQLSLAADDGPLTIDIRLPSTAAT